MLFLTFSSTHNKDFGSLPLCPHANLLLHFLLASYMNNWCTWLIFFKLSWGFAWWDHPTVFIVCLPTILLCDIESKSIWKWDERRWKLVLTLNHISAAEIRSHLLGRERACVTQQSSAFLAHPKPHVRVPRLWHQGFLSCAQDKSTVPSLLSGKDSLLLIRSRSCC